MNRELGVGAMLRDSRAPASGPELRGEDTPTGAAPDPFEAQAMRSEDRGYRGATFAEVRDAVFANPYQRVWGRAGEPALPGYDVQLGYLLRGVLSGASRHLFRQASARAVDERRAPRSVVTSSNLTIDDTRGPP